MTETIATLIASIVSAVCTATAQIASDSLKFGHAAVIQGRLVSSQNIKNYLHNNENNYNNLIFAVIAIVGIGYAAFITKKK